MSKITKRCLECNSEFSTRQAEIDRGYGKFCSLSCSSKNHMKKKPPSMVICTCANCGKEFQRVKSKMSKSKSGLLFCSRGCKDKAQRIGGISEIQPGHYGTGNGRHSYRKRAFESHGKFCSDCGFDEYPEVLEVHHKDGDRMNNSTINLIVLCPTCHQIRHFKDKSGRWS